MESSLYREVTGKEGGVSPAIRWLIICCCFCVALVIGAVALGLVIDLRFDLETHRYCMDLTGCKELPHEGGDPPGCRGDPNGSAWAKITVDTRGKDTVCVDVLVADTVALPVTKMHVHGPLNKDSAQNEVPFVNFGDSPAEIEDGGVLDSGSDGVRITKCVEVDKSVSKAITSNPQLFYLNVHNGPFPDGAVRDQLGNGCRKEL